MIVGMEDPKPRRIAGMRRTEGFPFIFDSVDDTALKTDVTIAGTAQSLVLEGALALTSLWGLVLMVRRLVGIGLLKAADGPSRRSIAMMLIIIFEKDGSVVQSAGRNLCY